jgi:hypothetical protein
MLATRKEYFIRYKSCFIFQGITMAAKPDFSCKGIYSMRWK